MLRSDSLLALPNGRRRQIDEHELRDDQIAGRLVAMPRSSINYTVWLQSAAERILYLSQLVAEAREMLAQVGGGWPPSRPMSSAPDDGTYVLLRGPDGLAVCRWATVHGGYWQMKGSAMGFNNPGRWWPLPRD